MRVLLISVLFISLNCCTTVAPNCCATDAIQGIWNFRKVISNPHPEEGLKPFPKSITIEFISKHEGKLTIQLPAQSKPKTYLFSKASSKTSKTVQTYYADTKKEYSLTETATTSYSEGILKIRLKWVKTTTKEGKPPVATGSYTFALNGKNLNFTRTNKYQNRKSVLKALYSPQK